MADKIVLDENVTHQYYSSKPVGQRHEYTKTNFNGRTAYTANYNNPLPKAEQYFMTGGWFDANVTLTLLKTTCYL